MKIISPIHIRYKDRNFFLSGTYGLATNIMWNLSGRFVYLNILIKLTQNKNINIKLVVGDPIDKQDVLIV